MDTNKEVAERLFFSIMPLIKKLFGQMDSHQPDIHDLILNKDNITKKESIMFFHMEVMYFIMEAGSIRMTELANKLNVSGPNLTVMVDKLVDKELVKREMDSSDRRVILLVLTDKGISLLKEKQLNLEQYLRKRISVLSAGEQEELSAALQVFSKYLNKIVNN